MIKNFPASLDKLHEMIQFVKEQTESAGFDSSIVSKIELATEEALVNIISYGYPDRIGTIEILCSPPEKLGIKIVIKDHGIPYNPLTDAKKYIVGNPLQSRTIGGYGVFFILKIMDEVNYKREDNYNVLTLVKYRS